MIDIDKIESPTLNEESNETSNVKNIKNDIYLVSEGTVRPLKLESVKSYVMSVCKKVNALHLDIDKLSNNVFSKLKILNSISEIENQIVSIASEMVTYHYDYSLIATYILVDNLHNNTFTDYLSVVEKMASNVNKKGQSSPIVNKDFVNFVREHCGEINLALHYERDFNTSIFGFRTLEKAYLKKFYNGKIIERPQHLYMRVAIALHMKSGSMEKIIETYDLLSGGFFTHATPTLFNAGTICQQLSSCFLLGIEDDMEGIGECWKNCAVISKYAGGIGINATNIRVNGSYIASTQGVASGLRLLHVFNEIARYADQGGKRAGSIAIYIEPWHGDIYYFLDLKKNTGAETERARDLFLGLMVNDVFMQRVKDDGMWSTMCPNECPDLLNKFGTEFTRIYEKYEAEEKYLKHFKARDLFFKIMEAQIETGVPYVIFKDAVNYKSNHINIGVINGSNLCVSGETQILTSKGYFDIKSKVNQQLEVWNGEEFSKVTVRKTGTNQELVQVKFSNGSKLKCTPYHKFYIIKNGKMVEARTKDLEINDKLIKTEYPIIENGLNDFKYPYTRGLFTADETYEKSKKEPKQYDYNVLNREIYCKRHINHSQKINNDRIRLGFYHDIPDKFTVPINYNINIKLKWLAGYLDGDGTVAVNGNYKSLQITSIHKEFLNNVKYMLQTMGCDPKVTLNKLKRNSFLPDSKRGNKYYKSKATYRLLINSNDTYNLVNLGLKTYRLDLSNIEKQQRSALQFITVTDIQDIEETEDTYCFTEPKRHMGIFNGIITGQCAEIVEFHNSKEYSVCFTEDTEILTKNGIKKIVDCDQEYVYSYFNNDIDLEICQHYEKATLVENGMKTVYALKTKGNKIVEATANHPFLVLGGRGKNKINKYQWKKLSDLEIGDKIITPRNSTLRNFRVFKDFSDEFLTAGWLIDDEVYTQDIIIPKLNTGYQSVEAVKYDNYNCIKKAYTQPNRSTKRIDQKVKNAQPIDQAAFLSGYFSAYGSVIFSGKKISINLTSTSEKMLYDVQSMLIPFGISSKIRFGDDKSRPGYFQGILSIHGKANINNFQQYIDFDMCSEKKDKLEKFISQFDRKFVRYSDYSKVISIKEVGKKAVYDLSLPKSHNFIANGHVVHNCNLSTICLPKYVVKSIDDISVDYQKLYQVSRVVTRNLDNIIDINFYPVDKTEISNLKHRPIGIGVQGLADLFYLFKTPFDSKLAIDLNKKIFETIYFGAMTESVQLAKERGAYSTFEGSPFSKGQFQFDLWGLDESQLSGMWDWSSLRTEVMTYGTRNSLLTTCPPTASTSQIAGNNECLVGNTKIYTYCGLTKHIEDFKEKDQVLGWNKENLEKSNCYQILNKGLKDTIKLVFEDGRKIKCTKDHKFLTYKGEWIEAKNIKINTRIMSGIEGTYDKNYGDEENYKLETGDYIFTMKNEDERYKTLAFSRILGYILADGNIHYHKRNNQYTVDIHMGNQYDVDCISDDIFKIEGVRPNVNDSGRSLRVRLHSKFVKAIVSLKNITIGKRITQKAKLPSFILDESCPKSIIREFLAGYFGGDGHAPSLSKPTNNSPTLGGVKLSHVIHVDYIQSIQKYMKDINKLMMKLGMNESIISPPLKYHKSSIGNKDDYVVKLLVPTGTQFLKNIGFRYCVDKMLKLTAANSYWRYCKNVIEERNLLMKISINHMDSEMKQMELLKLARNELFSKENPISESSFGSSDSLRYYYKNGNKVNNSSQKGQIGMSVVKYFENLKCLHWFNHHEYITDRLDTKLPYFGLRLIDRIDNIKSQVWDINVEKTHSFIANGIMVHNCTEPYTENIYTRNTLAGDYYIINKYLMKDLMDLGLWDTDMVDLIKYFKGSIANLPMIPDHIKQIYRTVWEIPQQSIIDMAADRAPFIDQTQSMNIFIEKPNFVKLTSCLFRAWELGLKTGMYYLRSKGASEANQFGIDIDNITELLSKHNIDIQTEEDKFELLPKLKTKSEQKVCKYMPKHLRKIEDCEMCSS